MPANIQTGFDFNRDAFSDLHASNMPQLFENARYSMPPASPDVPEELAFYHHAADLARAIQLAPGCRHYQVVSGAFIFGDFLEALLTEHHIQARELTISSFSYSQNNIDSLAGLMGTGHVQKLSLINSAGQHSHELYGLVPYLIEKLDQGDDRFQYAAAGTHCKLALIETARGNKLTIHGSANMRSSGCIEQFVLEEGAALYDFNYAYQQRILDRYKVINHDKPLHKTTPLRHSALWESVSTF